MPRTPYGRTGTKDIWKSSLIFGPSRVQTGVPPDPFTFRSHRPYSIAYRVRLPCATDVVNSVLQSAQTVVNLSFFVYDFMYAFWQIPLHETERPYFCFQMEGKLLCYKRTAQGSRTGPLAWAAIGALVLRLAQALFFNSNLSDEARRCKLQLYVDDPIGVLSGTDDENERSIQSILILWAALGFDLDTDKLHVGQLVPWCGVDYHAMADKLVRTIQQSRLRMLRKLIGKIANFASVLFWWSSGGKLSCKNSTLRCMMKKLALQRLHNAVGSDRYGQLCSGSMPAWLARACAEGSNIWLYARRLMDLSEAQWGTIGACPSVLTVELMGPVPSSHKRHHTICNFKEIMFAKSKPKM
eukprot:3918167-Amphidinium_carterae.3